MGLFGLIGMGGKRGENEDKDKSKEKAKKGVDNIALLSGALSEEMEDRPFKIKLEKLSLSQITEDDLYERFRIKLEDGTFTALTVYLYPNLPETIYLIRSTSGVCYTFPEPDNTCGARLFQALNKIGYPYTELRKEDIEKKTVVYDPEDYPELKDEIDHWSNIRQLEEDGITEYVYDTNTKKDTDKDTGLDDWF